MLEFSETKIVKIKSKLFENYAKMDKSMTIVYFKFKKIIFPKIHLNITSN